MRLVNSYIYKPLFCHSVKFSVGVLCGFISEWSLSITVQDIKTLCCLIMADSRQDSWQHAWPENHLLPSTPATCSEPVRWVRLTVHGLVCTPRPSHHFQNHSAAWDERHNEQNRSTQLTWFLLVVNNQQKMCTHAQCIYTHAQCIYTHAQCRPWCSFAHWNLLPSE